MTVSTGLSDFDTMVLTVLKMKYKKNPPKERDYKHFEQAKFKAELNIELNGNVSNWDSFENKFTEVLNRHAPMKEKILRANHASYMTKEKQARKGLSWKLSI